MTVYCMISTQHSRHYTYYALKSFFRVTKFNATDTFLLIDNDNSLEKVPYPVEILRNKNPLSFAANANQVLLKAKTTKSDVFILNNDLIFGENWLEALSLEQAVILSPLSNQEVQYQTNGFSFKNPLSLYNYINHEKDFDLITEQHQQKHFSYLACLWLPFYCVKIPYSVYSAVGLFDETYGLGGAEDNDYCIRTYLAGYGVGYATSSLVLHFSGKSTWSGAENSAETTARNQKYHQQFKEKWGERLYNFILLRRNDEKASELLKQGLFKQAIEALL